MRNLNTQLLFNGSLDFKQSWVAKLHDLFRLNVDEMVVLAELVRAFILRAVVPKLVLDDQPTVQKQVDGIVQGGPTDTVLVIPHPIVQ